MAEDATGRAGIAIAGSIWRWGGWAIGVTLAAAARQLLVQSGGGAMVEGIFQAIGAALLAAGGCVVLIWAVYILWQRTPSQQFTRIKGDIATVITDLATYRYPDNLTLEDMSSVRTVARKLDKLNIEHPPIDEKGSIWYTYVKRIFGEVNAGAIGDARVVWRGMKESMNDGR